MKILSNKEYEKKTNEKPQSYTYYMKDPYQAKKIEELESQNIRLEIESDKKDKEIERLNNIINDLLNRQNEALRYIGNHLSLDSRYKHGNGDKELTLVKNILNKHIKELKGSESNE